MHSEYPEVFGPIPGTRRGSGFETTTIHDRPAAADAAPAGRGKGYSPSRLLWVISGAPWIWKRISDATPAGYLHRFYQRHQWRHGTRAGHVRTYAGFAAGIPIVLYLMMRCMRLRGAGVLRETGKGRMRQLREQLALWLGSGVLPLSYYVFELYDDASAANALNYLFRIETKRGIYAILRDEFSSAETTEALRDKAAFARRCEKHGVAAIPALFVAHRGEVQLVDHAAAGLPKRDLFLKPLSGSGGRGADVWLYEGEGRYRNRRMGVLEEKDLLNYLVALSKRKPYIGRPYERNHPRIADLSPGALSSVRIVTCLDEAYRPEATNAVLRMASNAASLVDNFHAGGIAARVDLETGTVGAATDIGLKRNTQWWCAHPATGAQILGRRIPMWDEALALALRAHAAFPDQIIVGWDVAILEGGPRLIEGNKSPDLDIVQRTGKAPVGNSRLGVLLAHHVRSIAEREQALRTGAGTSGAGFRNDVRRRLA